jgi:putative nucleotidyltransferase with HDIG domain
MDDLKKAQAALSDRIKNNEQIRLISGLKGRRKLYLVGGTIRDFLLGRPTMDYDFTVSGSGVSFARTLAKKIGGAFVLLSPTDDEARVVKDEVIYDFIGYGKKDIETDLRRRDFTVNALGYDLLADAVLDPCDGRSDLVSRIVRPVTERSLDDDPLRVLRGFRFALELGFDLHRDFFKSARSVSLKKVAPERIGYELVRIMAVRDSYPQVVKMNNLGVFSQIFPEAKKIIEDKFLWGHSLETYKSLERLMGNSFFRNLAPEFEGYFSIEKRVPLLKLAALFHDVAKPDTFLMKEGEVHFYGHDAKGAKIVETLGYKRLKLSRPEVAMLKRLVKEHMRPHLLATGRELTDRAMRRFMRDLGEDYFGCMMIAWADGFATGGKTRHLEEAFLRMIEIKRQDDAKPKVERLVNGYDLIALGLKPGPIFKPILQELFDRQLEGKITTKEEGLTAAREIYENLRKNNKS